MAIPLRRRALLAGAIVAIPALGLYLTTLMPDVGFWDTAEFQAVGPVLGIAHPTGYPAFTLLAWLASVVFQPFGNEALRANMLSAVLGAGGVGIVAVTAALLTRRLVIGIAAGATLAVSAQAWSISLHADPHALHLFMASLILLLLAVWSQRVRAGRPADRWLVAAAIAYGVSLGNHGLTFLLAPAIAIFVFLVEPGIVRRPRLIVACAGALAVTTVLLYLYLPIRSSMNPPLDYGNPETWDGFRYLVFAEQFRGEFRGLPDLIGGLGLIVGHTFGQLGLLAVLAVLGSLAAAWRLPQLLVLLIGWFGLNWFFALTYVNADIERYYLVPLMAAAVLGALGAGALWDALAMFSPPATRLAETVRALVVAAVLIVPPVLAVPVRHEQVDQSGQTLARAWLTDVTRELPPNALVVSWWSYSTALWYGQFVEGLRPDVTVLDDSTIVTRGLGDAQQVIDVNLGVRPVFLIRLPFDMPAFQARYTLTPLSGIRFGEIYRVERLSGAAAGSLL